MTSRHFMTRRAMTLMLLAGCNLPPRPEPETLLATAAGRAAPIAFRAVGEEDSAGESSPQSLRFAEAIRRALEHDPRIQAALARVRMAEAEADQSWLLPNPVLTVAIRRPTAGGRPMVDAMLGEDLLALIQKPGLIRAADQQLRSQAAAAVEAAIETVAEVQETYIMAQALEAVVEELTAQRDIVAHVLELAQQRLTVGEGALLDVTSAEQRRVELETQLAEKVLEQRQARLALARLIGEPGGAASWALAERTPVALPRAGEATWVEAALKHRPEIQGRRWELAALGTEEGLLWSAPFEGTELGVESEREAGETAVGPSVSVPLPLFDLGQAKRRRAKAAVSEASHELTRVRRKVIEEVRSAHAAYLLTVPIVEKIRHELVPLAESKLGQAELQFTSGETGLTEVLLAEQDLRAARVSLIELEQKSATALIRLERAVGGPAAAASLSAKDASEGPRPEPAEAPNQEQQP